MTVLEVHERLFVDGLLNLMSQWQYKLPQRSIDALAAYCIEEALLELNPKVDADLAKAYRAYRDAKIEYDKANLRKWAGYSA